MLSFRCWSAVAGAFPVVETRVVDGAEAKPQARAWNKPGGRRRRLTRDRGTSRRPPDGSNAQAVGNREALMPTGSSQCGQAPPRPTRRHRVLHTSSTGWRGSGSYTSGTRKTVASRLVATGYPSKRTTTVHVRAPAQGGRALPAFLNELVRVNTTNRAPHRYPPGAARGPAILVVVRRPREREDP